MKNDGSRIRIGDICLAVTSDYPGFCEHFKRYYGSGLTNAPADFALLVHVQERLRREDIPRSLHAYRKERPFFGENFSLYDGMISGRMDLPAGQCELWVELALIASDYLPLFQDLLFRDLFHHVCRAKAAGKLMQLISPPLQANARERNRSMNEILAFSCRTVAAVPFSILLFSNRNKGFWDAIERFGE